MTGPGALWPPSLEPPVFRTVDLDQLAQAIAAKQIGNFEKLRKIASVNIVKGEKTDEGYHYLSDAGISVQGQDAGGAWRGVVFLAQNLKCPVEVSFLWRNKEGAEHPGKPGTMRLN